MATIQADNTARQAHAGFTANASGGTLVHLAALALVATFVLHGALYYLVPGHVYDPSHPLKYVKLATFLPLLVLLGGLQNVKAVAVFAAGAVLLAASHYYGNATISWKQVLCYLIPLSTLLIAKRLDEIPWRPLAVAALVLASTLGYFDAIFLKCFSWHGPGWYRTPAIFVNPNNACICVAMLTTYLLLTRVRTAQVRRSSVGELLDWLLIANMATVSTATGGRTGGVLGIVGILAWFLFLLPNRALLWKKLGELAVLTLVLGVCWTWASLTGRVQQQTTEEQSAVRPMTEFSSVHVRKDAHRSFVQAAASNPVFPYKQKWIELDDAYLNVWSCFGLVPFLLFLAWSAFSLWAALRTGQWIALVLLIQFALAGITTNLGYLWPLAYAFWGLSGYVAAKWHAARPVLQAARLQ